MSDPTNFGNTPGNGPLRVGGQSVSLEAASATPKQDLPSTLSKAAERQRGGITLMRDVWEGQSAIHSKTTEYLPQNPAEGGVAYAARLKRTPFHNFTRRAGEGLVGLVYRVDPQLGEDVPPAIVKLWENIDMTGTHGDVFCRDISTDSMVVGHAAIFVDYPTTGGTQTTEDEQSGEVRPYWLPIYKDNICSWRVVKDNGRETLAQVVLLEKTMVPEGVFGEREQTRWRHCYMNGNVPSFRLLEVTENKEVRVVGEGSYLNQTEIPISEVATSGKRGLFDSDPPLQDVAHLNVAYYQQYSDMIESQHKTVPFLFIAGMPTHDDEGNAVEVVVGPNSAIVTDDPAASAVYVSHEGKAISDQKATLDELKADIGSLSLAMLSPQKRQAETATAKRLDKSQGDSALSVTARAWQDGFERALQYTANYMQLDTGGSITINRDFEGLVMEAEVMRAYAELVKAGFPKMLALTMLQQGGRIAEDVNLEEVEMEMMANEAAAEAMREAEAAERLEAMQEEVAA